jgi:hypothetical protein
MLDKTDYSKLTLEELLKEEKRIKDGETSLKVMIGIAIGIVIYGIIRKGFGFIGLIFLPLVLIYSNNRNSQKLKQIQKEINARNTK